jgi:hypothetical protein
MIELDGQVYSIAGVQGGPLFDPEAHGLEPVMISTACWRGYVCWYRADDGWLRLVQLVIGAESKVAGRKIEPGDTLLGGALAPGESGGGFELQVTGLDVLIPFTGGLLLGQGFIRSTYVHMGFHPAWKYEKIIELRADSGRVIARIDRSAECATIRRRIDSGEAPDPDGRRGDMGWVKRTFSLDYSRSIPPVGEQADGS